MCGRIFQTHAVQSLLQIARTSRIRNQYNFNPTYNMGPTNYIPAIRQVENDDDWQEEQQPNIVDHKQAQEGEEPLTQEEKVEKPKSPVQQNRRGLDFFKWGYQTSFNLIINARVEEMHEKSTFKPLLNTRRCVVIAEGYYEWNTKKEPFMFKKKDKTQLMMAAMYSEDDQVFLLTRDAFGEYAKVHHRMPVLLEEDEIDMWINSKKVSFHEIIDRKILNQQKQIWTSVESVKIAPHVNNIREKSEKCQMTLEDYKNQLYQNGLGRFFKKKEEKQEDKQLEAQKEDQLEMKQFEPKEINQTQSTQKN